MPKLEVEKQLLTFPGWSMNPAGKTIYKSYVMKDFLAATDLIQKIAAIAEEENHHPDLHLTQYRYLQIDLSTHAINGISENDFILAAKIEKLPKDLKK